MIMNMGISFVLLLVVSVTSNAYEISQQRKSPLDWRNPFIDYVTKKIPNKAFNSANLVSLTTVTPSGYIVTTVTEGDSCDGNSVALAGGVGMDVCYSAENAQGEPVGSIYFDVDGGEVGLVVSARVFIGVIDCKGELFEDYDLPIPETCMKVGDASLSYSFSYTSQSDPWTQLPKGGLLQQLYDTSAHCYEYTPMGLYTVVNTNVCIFSTVITACYTDSYNVQFYSDEGCNSLLSGEILSLRKCFEYDTHPSNQTAGVLGYGTMSCNP